MHYEQGVSIEGSTHWMASMIFWKVVKKRRASLKNYFDISREFEQIEESCIPSYAHDNLAAAAISWWRLGAVARAYWRHRRLGPILDFGAASGELYHVVQPNQPYHFVEQNEQLASALLHFNADAKRQKLESLAKESYGVIFALDSLEHNNNIPELLIHLHQALAADGLLILSGPTENWIYRFGRRLAGFSGHYHTTTIRDIERMAEVSFTRMGKKSIPLSLAPLFNITVWKRK